MTQKSIYVPITTELLYSETELLNDLAAIYKKYDQLPVISEFEGYDFKSAIARCQRIIAARPTLRILEKQKKLIYK